MSEEMTVSVRQQVELHLKQTLLNFQNGVDFAAEAMPELRDFYTAAAAEFARVVDEYVASGKPEPEPEPEPQKIEVGDLVRLTGRLWGKAGSEGPAKGEIYGVVAFDSYEHPIFYSTLGVDFYIGGGGWEAEVFKKSSEIEASEL